MAFNEILKSLKDELKTGGDLFKLYHSTLESTVKDVLIDAGFATDVQQVLPVKVADLFLAKLSTDFAEPAEPDIQTAEQVAEDYKKYLEEGETKAKVEPTEKVEGKSYQYAYELKQSDLDKYPELVSAGRTAGQTIYLPLETNAKKADVQSALSALDYQTEMK